MSDEQRNAQSLPEDKTFSLLPQGLNFREATREHKSMPVLDNLTSLSDKTKSQNVSSFSTLRKRLPPPTDMAPPIPVSTLAPPAPVRRPRLQASPLEELEDKTGTQKEKPKRGTGLRSDSLEPTKHFSQVAVELGIDTEQLEYIDISYEVKLLLAQNFNRWLKGENVRHMDFSAKRFPFLPQAILALSSDVHGLNFRDNCLVELPPDFGHLRNLTTLDLSYNSLRNSDSLTNSFRSLTRIRHLFLSANSITHLPPTICLMTRLEVLELQDNLITTLPSNLFSSLSGLIRLDLRNNMLQTLDQSVGHLTCIEDLLIGGNPFPEGEFPPGLYNVPSIKNLDLHSLNIMSIEPAISKLNNLRSLDLSFNNIDRIPDTLGLLYQLEYLNISFNPITEIPLDLGFCVGLKLVMDAVKFNNIPAHVRPLQVPDWIQTNYIRANPSMRKKLFYLPNTHSLIRFKQSLISAATLEKAVAYITSPFQPASLQPLIHSFMHQFVCCIFVCSHPDELIELLQLRTLSFIDNLRHEITLESQRRNSAADQSSSISSSYILPSPRTVTRFPSSATSTPTVSFASHFIELVRSSSDFQLVEPKTSDPISISSSNNSDSSSANSSQSTTPSDSFTPDGDSVPVIPLESIKATSSEETVPIPASESDVDAASSSSSNSASLSDLEREKLDVRSRKEKRQSFERQFEALFKQNVPKDELSSLSNLVEHVLRIIESLIEQHHNYFRKEGLSTITKIISLIDDVLLPLKLENLNNTIEDLRRAVIDLQTNKNRQRRKAVRCNTVSNSSSAIFMISAPTSLTSSGPPLPASPPSFDVPKVPTPRYNYGPNTLFFELDPIEVARQLTISETELLCTINLSELIDQKWTKANKLEVAPNVMRYIQHFNRVSSIVSSMIVNQRDLAYRAKVLENWVIIAHQLRCINNFNGAKQVISGLQNASIYRLKLTWAKLSPTTAELWSDLQGLFSEDGNAARYRAAVRAASLPLIPNFSKLLKDITFAEDGSPAFLKSEKHLLNCHRIRMIGSILLDFQRYQHHPYMFSIVPFITQFVFHTEVLSDNQLFEESLICEDRLGRTPQMRGELLEVKNDLIILHDANLSQEELAKADKTQQNWNQMQRTLGLTVGSDQKSGYLMIRENAAWNRRWFVLQPPALYYYKKKTEKRPTGVINLSGSKSELGGGKRKNFVIIISNPKHSAQAIKADNDRETVEWHNFILQSQPSTSSLNAFKPPQQLSEDLYN